MFSACRYISLLCLLPALALADEVRIDPHADLLYRQALPFLEQADARSRALPLTPEPGDQELIGEVEALGRILEPAVALLRKAAELDHPVAQYRLALFYITYLPQDDIARSACPLLEASIRQGFAPAALGITTWCPAFSDSADYRQALERIPLNNTLYAPYYPQPAVRLECNRQQPQGLNMQWGRQRDFQAEVYRLLGTIDPGQRLTYYQKAVDINGCLPAQRRLTSQR